MRPDDERAITPEQRARVQKRIGQLVGELGESEVVRLSGIPQTTLNHLVRNGKMGALTLKRLSLYLRESAEDILNGTHSAGYYALREEGLGVGYPKRGMVLDGLRHVFPREVLDEVQAVVLPQGEREWTEIDWTMEVAVTAKRWQRLHNPPDPTIGQTATTDGHPPKTRV